MSHRRLGHAEEAKDLLARLRVVARQPNWSSNAVVEGFLREAEEAMKK
jgi:hypothetical protein